ncbi:MAG: nuclear transport factor 2 family protein [Pseudomonadota bacterium]
MAATDQTALELAQHLESRRARAVMDRDIDTVDALMADGLLYCHSTGLIEGKSSYIAKLAEGTATYHEFRAEVDHAAMPVPDLIIAAGRLHLDATVAGTLHEVRGRFLTVWRRDGDEWRMEALQGVPG